MRKLLVGAASIAAIAFATAAQADTFINGGFEDGTASGWTEEGRYRGDILNPGLATAPFSAGGGRSSVIAAGTIDPNVGLALGSTVYNGNYSYRVEDTTYGGYASLVSQRVNNYTDDNIFFAWKSVLLGAHGTDDAATMIITLTDLTTNTVLVNRTYNAANSGSGVDPRFSYLNNNYYTANWQVESLATGDSLGHDLLLEVIGADCQPTGHWGYVYLDGFSNEVVVEDGGVPEPATWAMMLGGFGLVGSAMRRRKTAVTFA